MKVIITIALALLTQIAFATTFFLKPGNLDMTLLSSWNDAADGSGSDAQSGDFTDPTHFWDLNGNSGTATNPNIFSISGGFLNSGAAVVLDNVDLSFSGGVDATNITLANSSGGTTVQYTNTTAPVDGIPGAYQGIVMLVSPETVNAAGNISVVDIEINSGDVLNMGGFTLTINAINSLIGVQTATIKTSSLTPALSLTGGGTSWPVIIEYNGAANQNVDDTYDYNGGLIVGGSGIKNASGDITVNKNLILNEDFDMGANQLLGTITGISGSGTVFTQNTSALPIPSGLSWGGVTFNAGANQTIPAGTFTSLGIDGSMTKTAAGNISVTILAFGSTDNILDMSTFQLLGGPLTIGFGAKHQLLTQNTSATPIPSGETWPSDVLVYFNANADQTIPGGTYEGGITINGSGTKTAAANITTNGIIWGTGSLTLDMSTHKLIDAGSYINVIAAGAAPTVRSSFVGDFPIPENQTWTPFNMIFEADGLQKVNVGKCTNLTISGGTGFNKRKTLTREAEITGTLTIETDCWLESGSNNITSTYQLLGNFTIAGGGTFSTTYLDSPDNLKDPVPQGLDWSSLDQFRYDNNAERLVGGTYSTLFTNGQGNNHFTTGNIICTKLRTVNEDIEITPGTYIQGNELEHTAAGEIIIQADNTGYGQILFTTNTGSSPIRKQFYIDATPSKRWVDISTALIGADLSDLAEPGAKIVFDAEGIGSAFEWDASIANWVQSAASGNNPTHGNRVYVGTRGAGGSDIFLRDGSGTISETATDFQKTSTSRPMTYNDGQNTTATFVGDNSVITNTEGWNFIANPFLANYDWDAAQASLDPLIRKVYYVWNGTNYVSRNNSGVGSAGQFIAPGQGFWIQVEPSWTANDPFPLDIANVDPTGTGSFLKTNEPSDFLSLKITELNGTYSDEVFMQFNPMLSDEFEAGYDAVNLQNAPDVPNLSFSTENGHFATLATSSETKSYNLAFEDENNGEIMQLSLNDEKLVSHTFVFVEDLKSGTFQELSNGGTYEFMNDVNFKRDRFVIHFTDSRNAIDVRSTGALESYFNANALMIVNNTSIKGMLKGQLLDAAGRVVFTFNTENDRIIEVSTPNLKPGVYILEVVDQSNSVHTEKLVKL